MLILIKTIHTIIWWVMALSTFYGLYAVSVMKFNTLFFVALGLIIIEAIILASNKFVCPLSTWAMNYTDERYPAFDIYLPNWVAKNNKIISLFA